MELRSGRTREVNKEASTITFVGAPNLSRSSVVGVCVISEATKGHQTLLASVRVVLRKVSVGLI